MLKPGCTLVAFDMDDAIARFCELSGWEYAQHGEWGARYDKPVTFTIDYPDGCHFFQHEQDYLCVNDNDDDMPSFTSDVLEDIKKISSTYAYKDKTLHKIPFGCIVSYLRAQGELPKGPIILTNCYWCH
jgi:hypothetical protein